MVPEGMDARFRSIAIQSHTVRVAGQAVHDGPTDAAGFIDLKSQVVVRAGDRMVMLVYYKVAAFGVVGVCFVQGGVGGYG